MDATAEYCDLCDLPRAHCVHGRPPPPEPAKRSAPPRAASVRAPRARPAAAPSKSPSKPVARRWTPPEVLRPLIVDVLREAGGELAAEDVFDALEEVIGDDFRPGDRETTPEGEPRWQYAARRARQALIADGVIATGRPGVWVLTDGARPS